MHSSCQDLSDPLHPSHSLLQVSFLSGLSEATRLMDQYAEKLASGGESLEHEFDNTTQNQ